jgi:LemA protein
MFTLTVVLVMMAVVLLAGVGIYNRLVALKHRVVTSWSNISVLLKQRHDELPKLVETCRQYMKYEPETLERVMKARAAVFSAQESADPAALGTAEGTLRAQLGKLFAVAEAYPELKANSSFQQLQSRISGLETAIASRREIYNDAVNMNNASIEQFPANIVANFGSFRRFDLLEFAEGETADVDVKALFDSK